MNEDGVVQIDVGPTKSAAAASAAQAFKVHLIESQMTPKGLCLCFRVDEDDEDTIDQILGALSRIRALAIHWAGNQYTRQEYNDICLDLYPPDDDEPVLEEDREFVALATACSSSGEWTNVSDGSYRDPAVRKDLLDIFACSEMREEIVQAAREVWRSPTRHSQRQVQYALEERFSQPHYTMEDEAWYGGRLNGVERMRTAPHRSNIVSVYPASCRCLLCRRLYLEEDGQTPRLFFIDEIGDPGTNVGRPLDQWLPTLPPLHLHCACSASYFNDHLLGLHHDPWGGRQPIITRLPSGVRVPFDKRMIQWFDAW